MTTPDLSVPGMEHGFISPLTIVEQYPTFFYFGCTISDLPFYPELISQYPIRKESLDRYTQKFRQGKITFQRSFREEDQFDGNLPNIAELTIWWLVYTAKNNNHHGIRSLRTPSSTLFGKGVLCIEFMANEALRIRPSYRPSPSIVVHPDP